MNSPNSMLPPALPSADAIEATFGLIALIADPTAAQKRLTEIDRAAKAYRTAKADQEEVAAKAARLPRRRMPWSYARRQRPRLKLISPTDRPRLLWQRMLWPNVSASLATRRKRLRSTSGSMPPG